MNKKHYLQKKIFEEMYKELLRLLTSGDPRRFPEELLQNVFHNGTWRNLKHTGACLHRTFRRTTGAFLQCSKRHLNYFTSVSFTWNFKQLRADLCEVINRKLPNDISNTFRNKLKVKSLKDNKAFWNLTFKFHS